MQGVLLTWTNGQLAAMLDDTPTIRKLIEALPCKSRANTRGEAVCFSLPLCK